MDVPFTMPAPRADHEVGYLLLVAVLSDPAIRQFVDATRERDRTPPGVLCLCVRSVTQGAS